MTSPFMKALYYGDIRPFEHDRERCPERDAVRDKIQEEMAALKSRLQPEDAARVDHLDDLFVHFSLFENEDCFTYGLRFGILLMMDMILAEREQPWLCREAGTAG